MLFSVDRNVLLFVVVNTVFEVKSQKFAHAASGGVVLRVLLLADWARLKNCEFRLARRSKLSSVMSGWVMVQESLTSCIHRQKMGVTDVTVGVTVTSRLHRSYCCSRILLLFCCYCSTLQQCSALNV